MSKYKRDITSGAAVLNDCRAVEEYLSKKNTNATIQALIAEINTLRQELDTIKTSISSEKR